MKRLARIWMRVTWHLAVAAVGFLAGAFVLYVYTIRNGPSLQRWHNEELTEEFTADRAGEIKTFADYQRLEQRLFDQLDALIYERTDAGPEFYLVRYSAGSAADPRGRQPEWNRSFELPAEEPRGGVLLLHGMSDSPYSLRALGQTLHGKGYWVLGLRLPGHGTIPATLRTVRWEDMAAAVRLAMRHLAGQVDRRAIHVVGYSTGAPLAVDYILRAAEEPDLTMPTSTVLISPALGITPAAALASWKGWLSRLPGLEKLAWSQITPEFDPYKYNSFAINAGDQVHRLTRSVANRVAASAPGGQLESFPPTLVFLSTVDATVSTEAVIDNLLGHLPKERHELFLFDINRKSAKASLLVYDPGPLTNRLLADDTLRFSLTVIGNATPADSLIVRRSKAAFSGSVTTVPLELAWPRGVISLSHVALPFPPDDPLYGQRPPDEDSLLHLGQIDIQGERGLLQFPADWLVRLRHNPFYDVLESRTLEWFEAATAAPIP